MSEGESFQGKSQQVDWYAGFEEESQFITDWHYFLKAAQARLAAGGEEELIKRIAMQILQYFYIEPYHTDCDFYEQFDKRLIQMKN